MRICCSQFLCILSKNCFVSWSAIRAHVHSSLASIQSLYCTVLQKNSVAYSQLSTALRGQHAYQSITTVLATYSKILEIHYYITVSQNENLLLSISLYFKLMYQALTSALNSYEGTTRCKITEPNQIYPKAFSIRSNRVLLVFAIFKGSMCKKVLALWLRTSAT